MSIRLLKKNTIFSIQIILIILSGLLNGCQQNLSAVPVQKKSPEFIAESAIPVTRTQHIITANKSTTPEVEKRNSSPTIIPTLTLQPKTTPDSMLISPFITLGNKWKLSFTMFGENDYLSDTQGVYVYSKETGNVQRISNISERVAAFSCPSWSPDGKQIVYYWISAGYDSPFIQITNGDGSGDKRFTKGWTPSWSPDGKEIVYILNDDIYKIEVTTKKITPLRITKDLLEASPVWSPDGKQIAYVEQESLSTGKLMIMRSDGSDVHRYELEPSLQISSINWSPDYNSIVLASNEHCEDIYSLDLETGKTVNLTSSMGSEFGPTWSPDGQWIVYSGSDPEKSCLGPKGEVISNAYSIFIMKKDGSNKQKITEKNIIGFSPVFSPVVPLELNKKYIVTVLGDKLLLRDKPSLTASYSKVFAPGAQLLTLEGPQMGGKDTWWRVKEVSTGLEGWVREGAGWLRPAGQE
jgi:hypothetical protein